MSEDRTDRLLRWRTGPDGFVQAANKNIATIERRTSGETAPPYDQPPPRGILPVAYATVDSTGSATGYYSGTEVWPDGSAKSNGRTFDQNNAGEILAPGATEGWENVSDPVTVVRTRDSAGTTVWVIADSAPFIQCSAPSDGDLFVWDDTNKCLSPTTIEDELKTVSGFSSSDTQYLRNSSGTLEWINTTSC